jgi:hypothetical protein
MPIVPIMTTDVAVNKLSFKHFSASTIRKLKESNEFLLLICHQLKIRGTNYQFNSLGEGNRLT